MSNYTETEKKMIVDNTKKILAYLKKDICPKLHDNFIVKFEDNPRYYKIMLVIQPNGKIEFTRGYRSTEFYLDDEYDSNVVKSERSKRYNFFERYDCMIALLENWKRIKDECKKETEKLKFLSDFEV